jgi:DNA-binding response OmpR family regulator
MVSTAPEPVTKPADSALAVPARLKLLCVTTLHQTSGWIGKALSAEGVSQARIEESVGATSALSRLREEAYDAVLVMHEPGVLDALEFARGLRAGGHDEPMVALGHEGGPETVAAFYEAGADAYCAIRQTTPRTLLWELTGAIRRCTLERDNRRLLQAERQRLSVEHQEAERLLAEQRGLLVELDELRRKQEAAALTDTSEALPAADHRERRTSDLPEALVANYRDVLRAYVIMGVGNLTVEMSKLAELLAASGVSAQRAVQLHLDVLEHLVHGLGSRGARHVMNRADLLILELMIHLADGYRRRYQDYESPPEQLLLPGFDGAMSSAYSAEGL